MKKAISTIFISELLVLIFYFYSFEIFVNIQVAFLSSLSIILGSAFAYKKMIDGHISLNIVEDKRDLLDTIEDPHELYDDALVDDIASQELSLKEIIKEEKAKVKTFSIKNMKYGARGSASAFRLVPYLFLILGFIALKNNELLALSIYLPSLFIGIIVGSISTKSLEVTM